MFKSFHSLFTKLTLIVIISVNSFNLQAQAQPASSTEVKPGLLLSGLAFGDFFMNGQNNNAVFAHTSGFWLRRAYLTGEYTFDDKMSARIRYEMNSNGDLANNGNFAKVGTALNGAGNTVGNSQLAPYLKDLWVKYKTNLIDKDMFIFGIQGTPTYDLFVEPHWGYRSVEKTPLDMSGLRPSRDFGISYQGAVSNDMFKWVLMYANNSNVGAITTTNPNGATSRFYLDLQIRPIDHLCLQLYGDDDGLFQAAGKNSGSTVALKSSAYQAHLSWTQKEFRVAFQYDAVSFLNIKGSKDGSKPGTDSTNKINVISAYAVYSGLENFEIFARYDNYSAPLNNAYGMPNGAGVAYTPFFAGSNSSLVTGGNPSVILLGVAYNVNKNFQIIPNIEQISYKDMTTTVGTTTTTKVPSDVYGKLTFFWKF